MKASIRLSLGVFLSSLGAAAQTDPNLQSGGLAPPPAIESASDQEEKRLATEQELERAEKEDSGRGLEFFWLNGEIGVQHLGLQTFTSDDLVDAGVVDTTQTGLVYGGGLGLRLIFITVGARFRMATFSDYELWTLNGEVGLRIPIGSIEPYATLGGGYASLGSFDSDALKELSVKGFDVRGGVGVDWYLSEIFSLGGNLSGDLLFLSRSKLDASELAEGGGALDAAVYGSDGSSIGGAVTFTLVAGLHF
jgi:hypothetical protein